MNTMATGTFYGVGIGPGDPELLTLKAVRVLSSCSCIYVPTSKLSRQEYPAQVARRYAGSECEVKEVTFSLAATSEERCRHWHQIAQEIALRCEAGEDVALVTLGDALLYSTTIYLLRALQEVAPELPVETVPGISAFSLAAALTGTPLGEGQQPLRVIPAVKDMAEIEQAVASGEGLVLMKIGSRLQEIIDLLERCGALDRSVFVARAGLEGQHVETDLRHLRGADDKMGNLSVVLVQAADEEGV